MNKVELINLAAKEAGLSQETTRKAVEAFIDLISICLATGQDVQLKGFGQFQPHMRLQTPKGFYKPDANTSVRSVSFKPSIPLKKRMNRNLK